MQWADRRSKGIRPKVLLPSQFAANACLRGYSNRRSKGTRPKGQPQVAISTNGPLCDPFRDIRAASRATLFPHQPPHPIAQAPVRAFALLAVKLRARLPRETLVP